MELYHTKSKNEWLTKKAKDYGSLVEKRGIYINLVLNFKLTVRMFDSSVFRSPITYKTVNYS
ncbi:hypothetical protein EGI31_14970 [Lacihabitans soyangensis]|uniref:Uncharacterized protein n=1 Tax=Lacihabitans soyangensis TaxID=869394 RepID=A0AAE3KRX2_9BACT|nr:hypothetical protein [Lacihabitans soyangensis]MCP9764163.1 hypothetical protein [Lacihabitans soyangensis]MCP9764168.1 hypothetical protein [Lacihabitans soyangensis]MCP9764246.1 hypothetical protein [Lacihabitans soyangensis]